MLSKTLGSVQYTVAKGIVILVETLCRKAQRPHVVETQGLEPWTPCLQSRCSSQLSYVPLRRIP
jgi:hypothetical protein